MESGRLRKTDGPGMQDRRALVTTVSTRHRNRNPVSRVPAIDFGDTDGPPWAVNPWPRQGVAERRQLREAAAGEKGPRAGV